MDYYQQVIDFFHAMPSLILLHGYTTWTLTKRIEKILGRNYARTIRVVLNKKELFGCLKYGPLLEKKE